MTKHLFTAAALSLLMTTVALAAEKEFPATLKAHAILSARTILAAPTDATGYLKTSGKFSTADRKRVDALGTVMGKKDGVRETGLSLPFDGQLMQGFLASRPWTTARSGRCPTTVSATSRTAPMRC